MVMIQTDLKYKIAKNIEIILFFFFGYKLLNKFKLVLDSIDFHRFIQM